jgi:hypothetical protein
LRAQNGKARLKIFLKYSPASGLFPNFVVTWHGRSLGG